MIARSLGPAGAMAARTGRYPAPVAGIPTQDLPIPARTAWLTLRDELRQILGDDLVAMWAHGGTISVEDPPHGGDLDTYVILTDRPDDVTAAAIELAQVAIARGRGVDWAGAGRYTPRPRR